MAVAFSLPCPPPRASDFPEWLDDNSHLLADWLELTAFVNPSGQTYLNDLVDALDLCWDQEAEIIHERDQLIDDIGSIIAEEIGTRSRVLSNSYPFVVSRDGSSIVVHEPLSDGSTTYLLCLILSHATRSDIVDKRMAPSQSDLHAARNALFEGCATLAAAAICNGPSFRIGALRRGAGGLLDKLNEIWQLVGDGSVRTEPHDDAPQGVNDGGVDVIAFAPMPDRRSGSILLFGQAASGHNWDGKEIGERVKKRFSQDWFDPVPASPIRSATFVPFRVLGDLHRLTHGHEMIVDRLRLPYFAARARDLEANGIGPIECLDIIEDVRDWVNQQKDHMTETWES